MRITARKRAEVTRASMESIRGPVTAVLELCDLEMKVQTIQLIVMV
jgi:hypothetical protein